MLLTKASEYALLSLIMISQKETPQDVDTLSTQLGISKSFLAKILQSLAKDPDEFSLKQIIACAEKKPTMVLECTTAQGSCPNNRADFCKILPFLNKLQSRIDDFLDNMSLKDIIS